MTAARELAVILGDGILISRWDLGWIGVADRSALILVKLAAQLQLQSVHFADQLLVYLFHQTLIPRETAGIQIAHLIDERLQLLLCLGTILHSSANLIEQVQSLVNLGLGIGWGGTLRPRHRGLAGDAVIAGIDVAIRGAASTPATRLSVRNAVALLATLTLTLTLPLALALTGLTTLALAALTLATLLALAVLPLLLTGLSALTGLLTVRHELTGLELPGLTAAAGLALARLRVGLSAESRELVAHTG
jgi:hypothetical protein